MARTSMADNAKLTLINITATGSMRPIIDDHSVVIAENYEGQKLCKGDIVVFNHNGRHIIHRVQYIAKDSIRTFGDNTKLCDGWIAKTDIKYRLVGIIYTDKSTQP